jgi:hypothetical protein
MEEFDIPIFKKSYELYKAIYSYRTIIAKQDRYTIWSKCENTTLDIIELLMLASQKYKSEKLIILEDTSHKLNLLRIFIRLMKDIQAIDNKKYLILQTSIDEIGRMLGGWIKSVKER